MKDTTKNKLMPEVRRERILQYLMENDNILTHEIAKEVNTSEITVRRDLLKLEEKGLLIRTRCGAVRKTSADDLFVYNEKVNLNKEKKDYICRIAAGFIKPGDIIFIDCGSTVSLLTPYIKKIQSLTVITNSLPIVSELMPFDNIKLILIGGEIHIKRQAVYGYSAVNNVAQYHADKAFIGADGVSLSQGITTFNEDSASVTLKMAENSAEVFLLCDSTKIDKNSFVRAAPLSLPDYVITDNEVDPGLVAKYRKEGVNLLCDLQNNNTTA